MEKPDNEKPELADDDGAINRIIDIVTLPQRPDMTRLTVPLRRALLGLDMATNLVDGDQHAFMKAQLVIAGVYAAIFRLLETQACITLPEIRCIIIMAAEAISEILAANLERDKSLKVRLETSAKGRRAPRSNLA
ncbi:hypothetical protein HY604_04400 [Candidatus Peregrinibacteria bacterium]|nr:hypothetical protein [Candidatus Peregrinibacteria bacterium]